MSRPTAPDTAGQHHWDATYQRGEPSQLSWYQSDPTISLELIEDLALSHSASVIDVGGGAATLVDRLIAMGFLDVSVLDLSDVALTLARSRIGPTERARWIHADLLTWKPSRRYDLWHDRAVLHFLVPRDARQRYLRSLRTALKPNGAVIIAAFGLDGPERCSGLPVKRYGPDDLADFLTDVFDIVAVRREEHSTPMGVCQLFTWVAARARE